MDNISKLVFGCLSLVGLAVMVIPNSDPLAAGNGAKPAPGPMVPPPPPMGPPSAPPAPPPGVNGSNNGNNGNTNGGFVVEDYNIDNFGEPMVDPTPPSQRNTQDPGQQQGVLRSPYGITPPQVGIPQGQQIPPGMPGMPGPPPIMEGAGG